MTSNLTAVPDGPSAIADALGIDDAYLLEQTKKVLEDALTGTEQYDRDGNPLGRVPNHTAALRAIELLMRHRGIHTPPPDAPIAAAGVQIQIIGLDPDRLI